MVLQSRKEISFYDVNSVREHVLEWNIFDEILYYLRGHKGVYNWAVFCHEKEDICALVVPHFHYHILIWYQPGKGSGKYYPNIPFTQFLRCKAQELNMGFIKTYNIGSVIGRINSLMYKNGHKCFCEYMSYLSSNISDLFSKEDSEKEE